MKIAGKRANFSSIQLSHHVSSKNATPDRVRTSYELTVAQQTSSQFAIRSKQDGKVIDINEKDSLIKLQYKDGTIDVLKYGEMVGSAAGSYYSHNLKLVPGIKMGSTVKPEQVLGYHTGFFSYDPILKAPVYNHGVSANIAVVNYDVVLEDSCAISSSLAEKLEFQSVYDRNIRITTDMVLTESVNIGDEISYNSLLLKLGYESTANLPDDMDELLDDLQSVEYRAKHDGVIVDIQVYYTSDEMTKSLKQYITRLTKDARSKAKYTKGTLVEQENIPVSKVKINTRIHGIVLNEMDILVVFYIKTDIGMTSGDKLCISTQLKSVVGKVLKNPPVTTSGTTIDVVFGALSIFDRLVLSALKTGIINKVLKESEDELLEDYFS